MERCECTHIKEMHKGRSADDVTCIGTHLGEIPRDIHQIPEVKPCTCVAWLPVKVST